MEKCAFSVTSVHPKNDGVFGGVVLAFDKPIMEMMVVVGDIQKPAVLLVVCLEIQSWEVCDEVLGWRCVYDSEGQKSGCKQLHGGKMVRKRKTSDNKALKTKKRKTKG